MPMKPNKSIEKELYVISTSHLDTVWSWELEQDIREYLPMTFTENFDLMRDFPNYKFNFEGAYRYQLLKEYYPELFEELKTYTANGQWNVAGSALENGDVNVPSPEALFRNVLYGNNYFDEHFGQRSRDIYLPDCFGFGYALPSVIKHANLQGFATQKLHWGAALPDGKLPYDIGIWKGPDGAEVIGDININDYTETFESGFSTDARLCEKVDRSPVGKISVLYGSAGDRGGAVPKCSVEQLCKEDAANDNNEVKVRIARVDDLIRKLYADPTGLSTYDGELLMHTHGTGSYTSQATGKRWNRKAELMAYAAEQSRVTARHLGAMDYPTAEFETAWTRVIAHQFHDDITGTSNAATYLRSRNDYMLSIKQFAQEYESGAAAVIRGMDTRTNGIPIVVHNPLAFDRKEVVRGTVTLDALADAVQVLDDAGNAVSAQLLSVDGNKATLLFVAEVPSLGYRVYSVVSGKAEQTSALSITENRLENERFTVAIDTNGDIASVYDKMLEKELLQAPIRFALFDECLYHWAAWEIQISDYNKTPAEFVVGTPQMRIVENGATRVALEITRKYGRSTFVQTISLCRGGDTVQVENKIDWYEKAKLLKCVFALAASNPQATYDLGLGAITRGNNLPHKSEVPMQKWADLTDQSGAFGVSILNDCKYGMDKLNDNTLRLTCIHTPLNNFKHSPHYRASGQDQQDMGENRFAFALYSHAGDCAASDVQQRAEAFNQPLALFATDAHAGVLGKQYSFGALNNDRVVVRAIKKAEKNDEIIIRVNEGSGQPQSGVELTLGNGIESAREMYASEEEIGAAEVKDGKLCFDIGRYAVKTFALTLGSAEHTLSPAVQMPLDLPYNADAYSYNTNRTDGAINEIGETYPAELVPDTVRFGGIDYPIGDKADGARNAVRCAGQTMTLPAGYKTLHLLAVSTDGDKAADFLLDGKTVSLCIGDYSENVAAGDTMALDQRGYIKPQTPAFVATHRHTLGEDNIANTTYMFSYTLDVEDVNTITLPADKSIVLFSAVLTAEKDATCITTLVDARAREDALTALLKTTTDLPLDGFAKTTVAAFKAAYACACRVANTSDATEADKAFAYAALRDAFSGLVRVKDGTRAISAAAFDKHTGTVHREQRDGIQHLGHVHNASSVTYKGIDFGDTAVDTVTFTYTGGENGKSPQITVLDGDNGGTALCLVSVPGTGDWEKYKQVSCKLKQPLSGEHDITLNFKGKGFPLVNLRTIAFTKSE